MGYVGGCRLFIADDPAATRPTGLPWSRRLEILGNRHPDVHAHLWPRYDRELAEHRG